MKNPEDSIIKEAKSLLYQICEETRYRDKEIMQGVDRERMHAFHVLRWVKKLKEKPSLALKLAALFHDIDRIVTPHVGNGFKGDRKSPDYKKHKKAHAKRSGEFILTYLQKMGIDPETVERTKFLISHHDDTRDEIQKLADLELEALVSADSFAFFISIAPQMYKIEGEERVKDKIKFMIQKMPLNTQKLLARYKIKDPIFGKIKNEVIEELDLSSRVQIADVIIGKNGKILMLKRNFEPGKGKLDLLGGFVEKNETAEQAAIREAKEESGFDVQLIEKLGAFDYFEREEKTMHVFIGKIINGKQKNSKEGKLVWIDLKDIMHDILAFPQVHTRALDKYKKIK